MAGASLLTSASYTCPWEGPTACVLQVSGTQGPISPYPEARQHLLQTSDFAESANPVFYHLQEVCVAG